MTQATPRINGGKKTGPNDAAKSKRTSKLKRLSDSKGVTYRGLRSLSNPQRAYVSGPMELFDLDSATPAATSRRQQRVPSVDPESMNWNIRNTSHNMQTRRPRAAKVNLEKADRSYAANAEADGETAQAGRADEAKLQSDLPIPKRRGRPPKVRAGKTGQRGSTTSRSPSFRAPKTIEAPRKRGRPRIEPSEDQGEDSEAIKVPRSSNGLHTDSDQDDDVVALRPTKKRKIDVGLVDDDNESDLFVLNDNDAESESQSAGLTMAEHSESDDHDVESTTGNLTHLLVPGLQTAFKAVKKVGLSGVRQKTRHRLPGVRSDEAKVVLAACVRTESAFKKCGQGSMRTPEHLSVVAAHLRQVRQSVLAIIRMQTWDTRNLVRDVFVHILPKLVGLLQSLLSHFRPGPLSDSTQGAWKTCRDLMRTIVDLGSKYSKATSDVVTEFPIKSLVKYEMVNNVRSALETLQNHINFHEDETLAKQRSTQHEERRQKKMEEERRSLSKAEATRKWKNHWASLHFERLRVEQCTSFLDPSKARHLATIPVDEYNSSNLELDANGVPFERVELLTKRVSRPSGSRRRQAWSEHELHDLLTGLCSYSGQQVYEKIFWDYCRPGRSLDAYNVSEIVEKAVWLRDQFIKEAQQTGKPVDERIAAIPDPREPPDLDEL